MTVGASREARRVSGGMWTTWIREWCRWRRAAEHRPESIRLGAYWVRRVALAVDVPPELVTVDDLVRFLDSGDWKPETRKCVRTAVRGFFQWARRTGRVEVDPSADLPRVRVPRTSARPVAERAVSGVCSAPDARVALAAVLAARMGLRRAEIAAACVEDVVDGRLYVRGKGGHVRRVRVHPDALPLLPESGPLVPSLHTGGHLTPDRVGRMLSEALGDEGTAHMLRHRFATVAYRRTRDLSSVQAVLGHQSLTTTQRYIATDEDGQDGAVMAA